MSDLRVVYDVTGVNLPKVTIPAGVGVALYVTGSGGVPASGGQLAAHPAAVQIDQSPVNTRADELADVIDFENGAATLADLPGWYRAAKISHDAVRRPGQRLPCVYCSYSNRTAVANAFVGAGIASGPRLWLADWDTVSETPIDLLVSSGGPFPVIGVQAHNAGLYDVSLFLTSWLDMVSKVPPPTPLSGVLVTASRPVTSTDGGKTWH